MGEVKACLTFHLSRFTKMNRHNLLDLTLVYSCINGYEPGMVLKNIKSFTALKIIDAIIKNPKESRKDCLPAGEAGMLSIFEENGRAKKTNYHYQFWQHENHPVLLEDHSMLEQRMTYVHENPVRAGFVSLPEQWLYSSAVDYYVKNGKGLLDIISVY